MFDNFNETVKKYSSSTGWLTPKVGNNTIRIVSKFIDYGNHYVKSEKKSCICIGKDEGCAYCANGDMPKVQFLGWVIDRADRKLKLFRMGYKIAEQVTALKNSDEYGFEGLPPYDITINRIGEGLDTRYNVMAARQDTELTKEEKKDILENTKDPNGIIEQMKEKINPLDDIPEAKGNFPDIETD